MGPEIVENDSCQACGSVLKVKNLNCQCNKGLITKILVKEFEIRQF